MKKNTNRKVNKKQMTALCLVMVFFFSSFSYGGIFWGDGERPTGIVSADENVLKNPRIVVDNNMKAGQKVTWDCVWFGSYPQAEVISAAMKEGYGATLKAAQMQKGDLIIDDTVYAVLQSATGWDSKGDITLEDGTKYRRIKRKDATNVVKKSYYYNWTDSSTYHYFKYQPIKWRVLSTDGNKAFLLSDKVLDGKQFNSEGGRTTWETSSVRRWLNGYESSYIQSDGKNFINSAFTSQEQEAILDTTVINDDNIEMDTEGGNNTRDKLFLLSETEAYFDTNMAGAYGFDSRDLIEDEARQAKSSTYAKAMGVFTNWGNSPWWLRSPGYGPGYGSDDAANVDDDGIVWGDDGCSSVWEKDQGVRPAFYLDLNTSDRFCSYAGTRCSEEVHYRLTDSSPGEAIYVGAVYVMGMGTENVTIPDTITIDGETCTVTSVAERAFLYYRKVKSATIGSNITIIPGGLFFSHKKLKEIIIKSENLQAVGQNAIKGIAKDAVIKVPEGRAGEYKKLFTAKTGYKKTMKIVEYDKAAYEEEQKAAENKAEENQEVTGKSLANPRKERDVSMVAGQKVTWDCVWFGSYPQAEVITAAMEKNYAAIGSAYLREKDLVIDDTIYTVLQSATGWDSKGDITLEDGTKYRRIKKKDATNVAMDKKCNYNWTDSSTYHYFKYQPIKWRVLSTDGRKALLLSDKVLDNQSYNTKDTKIAWETSTLRSWLNGYGASANSQGTSYRKKNFMDSAFNQDEKGVIRKTNLATKRSSNTIDKVFLLSAKEVNSGRIAVNNFDSLDLADDTEALYAQSSTYAKAMGVEWFGVIGSYMNNCLWWLRSSGYDSHSAALVDSLGWTDTYGWGVNDSLGIRVSLYLNLDTASDLYSYAGTRCSDEVHYNITSSQEGEAEYLGSEVAKTAIIPADVMLEGETYKVTSIAKGAFDGWGYKYDGEKTGIWSVTIGSNVTAIGENAFRKCKYLEEITIESENLQEIGKDAFKGIAKYAVIKVPQGKGEEYKKLFTAKTGYKETMEIVEESLQ